MKILTFKAIKGGSSMNEDKTIITEEKDLSPEAIDELSNNKGDEE